jgi:hypothetical protein
MADACSVRETVTVHLVALSRCAHWLGQGAPRGMAAEVFLGFDDRVSYSQIVIVTA